MEEIEYTGSPPDTDAAALLPIEEHAARQGVSPSILAAVAQGRHWAGGKQVSEAEFKGAVTTFLRGSMSGFKGR
jgi:hypothetical protein